MRTKTFLKKNKFRAFSLIELSVVITVVSVALVLFLSTKVSSVSNQKVTTTHDRIAIINKALEAFVAKNKRLPCPARIDATRKDAFYGEEGNCTAGSGVFASGNRIYGMVPIKALGLSLNAASDGFGNKFAYVIDARFKDAAVNSFLSNTSNPFLGNSAGDIAIKSFNTSSFVDLNSSALFAIISYGANGNYSYGADSSTPKTPTAIDTYEQKNSAANLVDHLVKQTSASTTFDDIVFYKDKANFLLDAKVSTLQSSNATGRANLNNSGCSVSVTGVSTTSVAVGSSSSFTCDTSLNFAGTFAYNCASSAPITGSCGCAAGYAPSGSSCAAITCTITGDSTNNLNSRTVSYAATSTPIPATACATGYTGSPTYTCTTSGAASISGTCVLDTCTFSGANARTGITSSTTVNASAAGTTLFCNGTGYSTTDSITYSCSNNTISNVVGACDTCTSEYSFDSTTSTCIPRLTCTGGTKTCSNGSSLPNCPGGFVLHKFTSSSSLTCSAGSNSTVSVLIVGGGGGGGKPGSSAFGGGGGGGGQVTTVTSKYISGGDTISVTVGTGGAAATASSANGANGIASKIEFTTTSSATAANSNRLVSLIESQGGGGGGGASTGLPALLSGRPGGGGGARYAAGTFPIPGGAGNFSGGTGARSSVCGPGGGGGSSFQVGSDASVSSCNSSTAGNGAPGISNSISGSPQIYGSGGGGGSGYNTPTLSTSTGGTNGGGGGGLSKNATLPTANFGGGGGGSGGWSSTAQSNASSGAAGVVFFSYSR